MLKGIDSRVTPELLALLAEMGHGDEIAIVDRNYPAGSNARRLVRLAGVDTVEAVRLIAALIPIDDFVDAPVVFMAPVHDEPTEVHDEALASAEEIEGRTLHSRRLSREEFYDRARHAFGIVATTESRAYGCLLITKGVIR